MAALSPEYCTIQRNTANITLKISTTTDLNFFADTLVENDFISKLTANGIVQTTGFTNYNKASQLMHAVESHISTASNPTTAFETFIKILKGINAPLKQLADELVQFYRHVQLEPDYRGPFSSQGVSGPAPSSSLQGDLNERPNLLKLLNFPGRNGNINIPQQVGTKYFTFGVLLLNDKTGAEMSAIVTKYRDDAEQINSEILRLWIGGKGKPLSWDSLIDVLNEIGLSTLASDIRDSLQH